MASRTPRHVACTRCRARKVKCDGRRPWCRGCSGSGVELLCSYDTTPPKAMPQKASSTKNSRGLDIVDQLQQPQQRLDQVENYQEDVSGLFLHLLDSQQSELSSELPIIDSSKDSQSFYLDDLELAAAGGGSGGGGGAQNLYPIDLPYPAEETSTSIAMQLPQQPMQGQQQWQLASQMSPSIEELQQLYDDYFAVYGRNLPLLHQKEFSELATTTTMEGTALRCAVCAIACIGRVHSVQLDATTIPTGSAQQYYETSKYMLESVKKTDSAIRILQTIILLILYELMTADFGKAWTTMSRAHWLVESMQLSKLCRHPWPSDAIPDETMLAYRAVMVLNTFFSVGMSSSFVLPGEFVNETFPMVESSQNQWHTFGSNDDLACTWPGNQHITSTVILLCHRIVGNIRSIDSADLDNTKHQTMRFQQHKLEKDLRYIANLSSINALQTSQGDLSSSTDEQLVRNLLLKVASLLLHESSLLLLEKEEPLLLGSESMTTALTASTQKALELAQLLQAATLGAVARTNIFLPWIFDVTIKVLKRQQQYYVSSSSMQDLQGLPTADGQQLFFTTAMSSPPSTSHSNFHDISPRLGSFSRSFSSSSASSSSRHLDSLTSSSSSASSLNFAPQLSYTDFTSKSENFLVVASIAALKTSLQELRLSSPLAAWFDERLDEHDATSTLWNRRQKIGLVDFVSMPQLTTTSSREN